MSEQENVQDPEPNDEPNPAPSQEIGAELSGSADVAIIGMAGRFPGAPSVDDFWRELCAGTELIRHFTDEELLEDGADPAQLADPNYVKAWGHMEGIELFDAGFFDFTPREAEITDPQIRCLLEVGWEALEHAGCDPERYPGAIGVFAGTSSNAYVIDNLLTNPRVLRTTGFLQTALVNQTDFLSTRLSYKLDLKGPSITVQTACSTSLVAVHLGCQSLLSGESDVVLAGGVCITVLKKRGYVFVEGGTFSSDGHVRTFDKKGEGMLGGNGAGLVVLKRLEDAVRDGDTIHAVIKGSALNNDGVDKVGFTAPSVNGQAKVILDALDVADVDPGTIGYVEAHGTATPMGDPIEIAALTQAWRTRTQKRGFCPIGAVKTNVGHLDIAAGVTGLIKAALSLEREEIPPSLNFEEPNPEIDFAGSPFVVNTELKPWKKGGARRRAAVSSFGMGGTNAHAVLEEAPEPAATSDSRAWQLLLLSARNDAALAESAENLAAHLESKETSLADAAYTLQVGRKGFEHRRALVCRDAAEAVELLRTPDPRRSSAGVARQKGRSVAFLFTGQGAQFPNMTRGLYESEPIYRAELDRVCELCSAHMGRDLRELLFPEPGAEAAAAEALERTENTQPALFAVEYALARQWRAWGVVPEMMVGHSIGEYAAAALAGVFSLEDAARIVVARGRLIGALPAGGGMLAVHLSEGELRPKLERGGEGGVDVAAVNAPGLCVVSGPEAALARLEEKLEAEGVSTRRLRTSHAFHSSLMDPMLEAFEREFEGVTLRAPEIRFVSCSTGAWITVDEAQDPGYWVRHVRRPVRFAESVRTLLADQNRVLLEVGPGETLSSLAKLCTADRPGTTVVASTRHPNDDREDPQVLLRALGELWTAGVTIDWDGFRGEERRRRIPLPTYPFQRERFWIEAGDPSEYTGVPGPAKKRKNVADWFYVPAWERSAPPTVLSAADPEAEPRWLVFTDESGVGAALAARLEERGESVATVRAGASFTREGDTREGERSFTVAPGDPAGYAQLLQALQSDDFLPTDVVHLWGVDPYDRASAAEREAVCDAGFYSVLFLAQALSAAPRAEGLRIGVVTTGREDVLGGELTAPEKATVLGACKAIHSELEGVSCRAIDVEAESAAEPRVLDWIAAEVRSVSTETEVAYRGANRWTKGWRPVSLEASPTPGGPEQNGRSREGQVVLVTGGLGGVGLALAEEVARAAGTKLVLVGRTPLPDRDGWDAWLAEHGEDQATSRKILSVRRLEELGAEVLDVAADVTDLDAMRAALDTAEGRFGPVTAVIHAAGLPGAGILELKTRETAAEVLAPKVRGTQVLEELLADRRLDYFLCCSSIASCILDVGQIDYFAANAYLDAWAHYRRARGDAAAVSVNWDAWQEVGMAVETEVPDALRAARAENLRLGVANDEGRDAFGRILAAGLPQVVVSPRDLSSRIEVQTAALAPGEPEEAEIQEDEQVALARTTHARPELSTDYVEPASEMEHTIADVWQDLLGIDRVGVNDNFFELGGNSLVMMQLNVRLRSIYGISLPIRALFETPEVNTLAERIESLLVLSQAKGGDGAPAEAEDTEEFTL